MLCLSRCSPNIPYAEGQPVVEGNMVSDGVRKLDVFKSMGPSRIQPMVPKEMIGTLSTIPEKVTVG